MKLLNRVKQAGFVLVGMVATAPMHAALSTEEEAVFTAITTKIADLSAAGLPILGAIIGLMLGIKLIKKVSNKVT